MPELRRHPVSWFAALLCALVPGCVTTPAPDPLQALPPIRVPYGDWEIVAASFGQNGRVPGAPRATLAFEDGRVSVFSGCNTASGEVRGVEGRLEVQKLAATRRSCPEPLGWFESRLFGLLKAGPVYHEDGDVLTLVVGNDNARFRRAPAGGGQPAKP
jgi:heat shock protein HslJ